MIQFEIKQFKELDIIELYDLLQLRAEVFVVEQDCVYQDVDGKDMKAMHVLGYEKNHLAAYTRIFKAGDYFDMASIGRVVVSPKSRGLEYGKEVMNASMDYIFTLDAVISTPHNDPINKLSMTKDSNPKITVIEQSRSDKAINPTQNIKISAQVYLMKFYNDLGFIETGKRYLEDGIPHMEMVVMHSK